MVAIPRFRPERFGSVLSPGGWVRETYVLVVLSDVAGVKVGHWTDAVARTGCTVVVLPPATVASGEVRGGAPATREFELLHPDRRVSTVDAVVLSGGSAYGLAAADGVMQWLEEQRRGIATVGGVVPIVIGMCLYDLAVGDPLVRPGAHEGRIAAMNASEGGHDVGLVGAGTGATVGKWGGRSTALPGGLGTASVRVGDLLVSALIAVNAFGFIDDGTSTADIGAPRFDTPVESSFGNTTIGVIATNAIADKRACHLLAQSGHDGISRALLPAHTEADGDALVAVATGEVTVDLYHLRLLAQQVVTRAIRNVGGYPAATGRR